MPQYKLYYFNTTGRAELIRFIFALKGIEYEDIRYSVEEWAKNKDRFPLGQVPVLEVDGYTFVQSLAITRYLATEFGLYGSSSLEQANINAVVDTVQDFFILGVEFYIEKDEALKAAKGKTYVEEIVPKILKQLEVLLERNTEGQDYFIGNSITLADLCFAQGMQYSVYFAIEEHYNMEKHPKLQAVYQRVVSEPNIAAWMAKRPPMPLQNVPKH